MTENSMGYTYVGIDIAKDKCDCFSKLLSSWQENNTNAGLSHFIKQVSTLPSTAHVILEASGGIKSNKS